MKAGPKYYSMLKPNLWVFVGGVQMFGGWQDSRYNLSFTFSEHNQAILYGTAVIVSGKMG